jgi:hypothetical protein
MDSIGPGTVAALSKAWTVFTRSDAGIVDSNLTQGMDVWCMCLFWADHSSKSPTVCKMIKRKKNLYTVRYKRNRLSK